MTLGNKELHLLKAVFEKVSVFKLVNFPNKENSYAVAEIRAFEFYSLSVPQSTCTTLSNATNLGHVVVYDSRIIATYLDTMTR